MKHNKAISKAIAPQSAQIFALLQKISLIDTGLGLIGTVLGWFGKGGSGGEQQ